MTLQEFLKAVGGKESDIISYSGQKAMAAVKQNGYSLQYVKEQTPEICMAAVKQDGDSLRYVKEQTPEICMAAVKQNGDSLRYVKEQTPEICMAAVKQDGDSLQYVKEQIFSKVRTLEFDGKSISISEESYQSLRVFFSNINKEV